MSVRHMYTALLCMLPLACQVVAGTAAINHEAALQTHVSTQVSQLMQEQHIPGMAVAVLWQGKIFYYNFGYADVAKQRAVTTETLFELGYIS